MTFGPVTPKDIVDRELPYIVQRWVNGHWQMVARCAFDYDARKVRGALQAFAPDAGKFRAIGVRYEEVVEVL